MLHPNLKIPSSPQILSDPSLKQCLQGAKWLLIVHQVSISSRSCLARLSLNDLPPLFVIRSNVSRGDTLTLHTARGSTAFRLQQSNDGVLCLSGSEWTQFVTANELNETYVLLMIHRGNMHFNVKVFDQSALCIESDGDEDDNEDANDANPLLPNDVIDVEDYDENDGDSDVEVVKIFRITVPPSSGYNYRHARLARLTITTRPLMGYNLLDFNLAILKVPAEGNSTWSVNLKWISSYSSSGEVGRQSFAFKEGRLEFANANRIRGGDTCVFKINEAVGNKVNMDVVIERRVRGH
ncbi:hypothetical protein BUALT_Bualt02G0143000 [Buddleja alternifolia]|uniref:TF-B3 domain-containing protein n=1 Tax=Buddleja alternifolia TaxID=168488 RepID=A0AAV6Y6V8_9LAMI|nr:hypothetical protein BUALT_Bualt02G0143000 [Buddleja alternifolia]